MAFLILALLSPTGGLTQSAVIVDAHATTATATDTTTSSTFDPSVHRLGYVLTPAGWFDPTNVHKVANGTKLDPKVLAHIDNVRLVHPPGLPGIGGNYNNYVLWGDYYQMNSFTAQWTVPAAPQKSYIADSPSNPNAQNYFLWNGAIDDSNHYLLQPVLQWGCSDAVCTNAWYIDAWFVYNNQQWTIGTPVQVYQGDQIYGLVTNDNNGYGTVSISDITRNVGASIYVPISNSIYFHNLEVVQESTNLPQGDCGYLSGNVDFYKIQVDSGAKTPSWEGYGSPQWCHMYAQVQSPSEVFLKETSNGGIWIYPQDMGTGNQIAGLSVSLYNSNGQLVTGGSGYSPLYVPITSSGTYHANFDNYGPFYFTNSPTTSNYDVYNWGGQVTSLSLSSSSDFHLDGNYYDNNNPGSYALVQFKAHSTSCNCDPSPYVGEIDSGGHTLSQGYTPYTVGIPTNQQVTVDFDNGGGYTISSATTNPSTLQTGFQAYTWGAQQTIDATASGNNGDYDQGNYS
jgi:hypothetical protein